MSAEEEKESLSVSFIRIRTDLGNYRIDLPSGTVQIEGLGVYTTDDPDVIEALSCDPELTRYSVDPVLAKPSRKK